MQNFRRRTRRLLPRPQTRYGLYRPTQHRCYPTETLSSSSARSARVRPLPVQSPESAAAPSPRQRAQSSNHLPLSDTPAFSFRRVPDLIVKLRCPLELFGESDPTLYRISPISRRGDLPSAHLRLFSLRLQARRSHFRRPWRKLSRMSHSGRLQQVAPNWSRHQRRNRHRFRGRKTRIH